MEGGFEKHFAPLPEEIEAAREKAIAMGADPDAAEEALRQKMSGATAKVAGEAHEDAHERAMRSLEKAFEETWRNLTPEQKAKIRRLTGEEEEDIAA